MIDVGDGLANYRRPTGKDGYAARVTDVATPRNRAVIGPGMCSDVLVSAANTRRRLLPFLELKLPFAIVRCTADERGLLLPLRSPADFEVAIMQKAIGPIVMILSLAGCASMPSGPDVAVMPGPGKSFEQFAMDDNICRSYAGQSTGTNADHIGAKNVATGAAVGTALGAAAGAAMGGHHGTAGGAGAGLLLGSAIGAGNANSTQQGAQRRYDIAYEQCMYAKGNQLPPASTTTTYYGGYRGRPIVIYQAPLPVTVAPQYPAPQPATTPPPPPYGSPPPPPPGN